MGCKSEGTCTCISSECVALTASDEVNDGTGNKCCICFQGGVYGVRPETCCHGHTRLCCLDVRYAFPCVEKVPCLFTILPFCVCCANNQAVMTCGADVKTILEKLEESKEVSSKGIAKAPTQQQMTRGIQSLKGFFNPSYS